MATETPEYVCNHCGRGFCRKYNILNHLKHYHVTTSCFCDICEQKFQSPVGLRKHLENGHNRFKQGNPECDECGKTFSRKETLASHLRTNHFLGEQTVYKSCEVCNKKFSNLRNLNAHIKNIHTSTVECPTCDECSKVFRTKESLVAHIQAVHKVSARDIQRCSLCEKVYSCKKNLKRHMIAFHAINDEYKCDNCPKSFNTNDSLRRHVKTVHNIDLPKEFACENCSRVFPEQALLDSHITLHHKPNLNPLKHSCECGKVFDSEPSLRQHIKSDHDFDVFYSYCKNSMLRTESIGGEKSSDSSQYDCEICKEHFESLYDLRNHMKANHDLKLSLDKCKICFVQFFSKEAMVQHQKKCVAPNNSIKCEQCDKLFTAKSSLNFHMKVFHPPPEKPPSPAYGENQQETSEVKCKYCDKIFKSKWILQNHIDYEHLGKQRFKCIQCESQFKERRNLRKHIRLKHPTSSTFSLCRFCKKRFESAKVCNLHLKQVHSFDANNFPCDICAEVFTTNDLLTLHMKTKHTDEQELFKCESCSILFRGYETFERHSQKCEENVATAPEFVPRCVICMKDFCAEKSLRRHIRIFHEGFDPTELAKLGFSKQVFVIDCKECVRQFTDEGTYRTYLKNKKISDAQVFKCKTCGDTYNVLEFAVQRYKKTVKARKRKRAHESDEDD